MTSPLRVTVYTDSAGIGGAEISLSHLAATVSSEIHLAVVGVDEKVVHFIAASRSEIDRFILPVSGIGAFLEHRRTFQQLHPDIIHCNLCTPWAGAIGLAAALSLPKVRVVRVDQLPLRTTDMLTLWRTRALCLRSDAHVAVGQASATKMEDFYALGRNSVISIPNGVPDGGEPELPAYQNPAQITVGSIGRLDAMKAHDILLRAVAQVPQVRAVILGDGGERSNLEKLSIDLGIRDRVKMPGWVDRPQAYLPQFDVVAMPSRSEGFPLAMVEAMLAARPVIATRVGSMPEAIQDGITGLLIDKNDVDGLARSLKRLQDNPEFRQQLGKQARNMALTHFTVETMTYRYETLWRELLDRPPVPRLKVPRPKD